MSIGRLEYGVRGISSNGDRDDIRRDLDANGNQITNEGSIKDAKENVNKTVEEAQEKHDKIIQELLDSLELEEGQTIEFPYLVRGARLCCSCGTHKRKLNLPLCHGVYVAGKPMIQEEDCQTGDDQNIAAFGICQSEGHPLKNPWWVKLGSILINGVAAHVQWEESNKIILQTEDGKNVKGYACTPCIVGTWKDVHETQKIARNDTDGTAECDRLSAVTLESFLVCAYGGLIQPLESGQDEEPDEGRPVDEIQEEIPENREEGKRYYGKTLPRKN